MLSKSSEMKPAMKIRQKDWWGNMLVLPALIHLLPGGNLNSVQINEAFESDIY